MRSNGIEDWAYMGTKKGRGEDSAGKEAGVTVLLTCHGVALRQEKSQHLCIGYCVHV